MSFVPCELHCHTLHSDGGFEVSELQKMAKKDGLSLIALTDHNTMSGHAELNDEIIPTIRGIEWTTYFGHMLVLGAKSFVDWRNAVPDNIDEKIAQVKNQGGLVGIAHPFQLGSPMCTGGRWEFNVKDFDNVDYVEIWHQSFSEGNYENDRATAFWTSLLDKGHRIAASYGRDWHRPEKGGHFGCTFLDIDGELTPENAMEAIKNGRTVVSAKAEFHFEVKSGGNVYRIGDEVPEGEAVFSFTLEDGKKCEESYKPEYEYIKLVTNGGQCVSTVGAYEKEMKVTLERGHWYRAELWGKLSDKEEVFAITSPIYVKE